MQSTVDTVSQFNWYIRLTIFPFAINLPLLFLIRQHLPPSADVTVTLTHNSVSVDSTSADDVMVTSRVTPYYVTTTRRSRLCRRQQPSEHLQVTRASLQCIVANRRLLCATCSLVFCWHLCCHVTDNFVSPRCRRHDMSRLFWPHGPVGLTSSMGFQLVF